MSTVAIDLIQNHFDSFQATSTASSQRRLSKEHTTTHYQHSQLSKNNNHSSKSLIISKTEKLREELIYNFIIEQTSNLSLNDKSLDNNDDNDDDAILEFQTEISNTLINIINSVLSTIVSKELSTQNVFAKSEYYDSAHTLLQYVASFICSNGDGSLAREVFNHLLQFSSIANYESMRSLICSFVGWCSTYLLSEEEEGKGQKKKEKVYSKMNHKSLTFLTGDNYDNKSIHQWKVECVEFIVSKILMERLYDKNQAVRSEAIRSSCMLLSSILETLNDFHDDNENGNENTTIIIDIMHEVTCGMKWSMTHDPSFANRSTALQSIPLGQMIQAVDTNNNVQLDDMKSSIIECIVERVRDEKVKVRVDALDILSKVNVENDLDVDMRCEILRHGLSTRYPATLSSAVRMLCCGWMKTMKFDPVATMALLDPVKNEAIAESAAKAIISTAGVVGYDLIQPNETVNEAKDATFSSDIVLMTLSDAEIREFKRKVMDCGSIEDGLESGNDVNDDVDITKSANHGLSPARMIYIRIMCDLINQSKALSEYKKSTMISRCVSDVTVLSAVLEKHIDVLKTIETIEMEEEETINQSEDDECFVCLHLLKLATIVDLNEEGSRRHLNSIIHRILSAEDTHDDLIESCVHVLKATSDTETSFLQSISEILAGSIDVETGATDEDIDNRKKQHLRVIEILSVSLEKISLQISSNPILQNFSSVILTTITDSTLGEIVREAGVSCLGRYTILLDEDTVIEKYKPLLLDIANMKSEKIEIRAQALLAICDIALRFDRFMSPVIVQSSADTTSICVSDVILDYMINSARSLLIVAAEVAVKLMFFGRLHDAKILAHLITLYFDQSFSADVSYDDVMEVGSPARLQQMLAVFFPAYFMKSAMGKETLLACVSILLSVVNDKMSKKVRGKKSYQFPISKMLDYIFDLAEKCSQDPGEASHSVVISLAVAGFLEEHSDDLSSVFIRSLCKTLSTVDLDIATEEPTYLRRFKNSIEELTMHITDDTALRSIHPLMSILSDVQSDDESESEKNSDDEKSFEEEKSVSFDDGASYESKRNTKTQLYENKDVKDDNNENDPNPSDVIEDKDMDEINKIMEDIQVGEKRSKARSRVETKKRRSYEDALPTFAMIGGNVNSKGKQSAGSKSSTRRVSEEDDEDLPVFARVGSTATSRKQTRRKRLVIEESSESEDESSFDASSAESESSVDDSSEDEYSE